MFSALNRTVASAQKGDEAPMKREGVLLHTAPKRFNPEIGEK